MQNKKSQEGITIKTEEFLKDHETTLQVFMQMSVKTWKKWIISSKDRVYQNLSNQGLRIQTGLRLEIEEAFLFFLKIPQKSTRGHTLTMVG